MKNKVILSVLALLLVSSPFIRSFILKKYPSKESISLIVGVNAEYPPFSYVDNNEIIGFDIDLSRELAKRMNKELKLVDMPFESLISAGLIGKVQLISGGMTYTKERAKKVIFTKPYLRGDSLMIVSKADLKVQSLEELAGKKIIVNEGYTADLYLSSLKEAKTMNIIRLNNPCDGFLSLSANRADAFITSRNTLKQFLGKQSNHEQFNIAPIKDAAATDEYSVIISPKHKYLLNQVEELLDEMKSDGTINRLKKKWKLFN